MIEFFRHGIKEKPLRALCSAILASEDDGADAPDFNDGTIANLTVRVTVRSISAKALPWPVTWFVALVEVPALDSFIAVVCAEVGFRLRLIDVKSMLWSKSGTIILHYGWG